MRPAERSSRGRFIALIALSCILSTVPTTAHPAVVSPLWVRHLGGPANSVVGAAATGVSPDGSKIFVTGRSEGPSGLDEYATVAYDTRMGHRLWERRYDGRDDLASAPAALAVSPGGARVFVTGESAGAASGTNYATVAYRVRTGATLWTARYDGGEGDTDDAANAIGVSPDGQRVFVTGTSGRDDDFATVAYDATTGERLWVTRYAPRDGGGYADVAAELGVSPDGSTVFVTGSNALDPDSWNDYTTVAYDAATGAELWARRYDGPGNGDDVAWSLAVTPDGSGLIVTGSSEGALGDPNFATVRYDTQTGTQVWARRFDGPHNAEDFVTEVGVSPNGSEIFVTGTTSSWSNTNLATVAYTGIGGELWSRRYDSPANGYDVATGLGVASDGSAVFVTGHSTTPTDAGLDTVAYDAATGVQRWSARYAPPGYTGLHPVGDLGVSRDGSRIYVTGLTYAGGSAAYTTVAYQVP
jgi:hypothetical protein